MDGFCEEMTRALPGRETELSFAQCDARRKMKLSAMLSLLVSAAGWDYDARGLTYERLLSEGKAILLSRITLAVSRLPENRDVLRVETWENGVRGVHMRRCFRITDQAGRPCVDARSQWVVVEPASRRILRPTACDWPIREEERPLDCPDCPRLAFREEDMEPWGGRHVLFSDLDGNGHLYSGFYGNYVWDALPADLQTRDLKSFSITYSHEATLGTEICFFGRRTAAGCDILGKRDGETCFMAQCGF